MLLNTFLIIFVNAQGLGLGSLFMDQDYEHRLNKLRGIGKKEDEKEISDEYKKRLEVLMNGKNGVDAQKVEKNDMGMEEVKEDTPNNNMYGLDDDVAKLIKELEGKDVDDLLKDVSSHSEDSDSVISLSPEDRIIQQILDENKLESRYQ